MHLLICRGGGAAAWRKSPAASPSLPPTIYVCSYLASLSLISLIIAAGSPQNSISFLIKQKENGNKSISSNDIVAWWAWRLMVVRGTHQRGVHGMVLVTTRGGAWRQNIDGIKATF